MGSFDSMTAETLGTSVDKLPSLAFQAYSDSVRSTAATGRAQIRPAGSESTVRLRHLYRPSSAPSAVMVGFAVGYALCRIRAMSATMVKIAAGDFTQSVPWLKRLEEHHDASLPPPIPSGETAVRLVPCAGVQELKARAACAAADHVAAARPSAIVSMAAASAGNFEQRVAASFADPELNDLAMSVNTAGRHRRRRFGETGRVLAAPSARPI